MNTEQPLDIHANPVPALLPAKSHSLNVSGTASRTTDAFTASVVMVYSDVDCFLAFGDNTVDADTNSHFHAGGLTFVYALGDAEHISAVSTETGKVYISEMK